MDSGVALEVEWRGRRLPVRLEARTLYAACGAVPKCGHLLSTRADEPGPSLFASVPGTTANAVLTTVYVRPLSPMGAEAAEEAAGKLRRMGYLVETEKYREAKS